MRFWWILNSPYIQLHSIRVQKEIVKVWGLNKDWARSSADQILCGLSHRFTEVQKTVAGISGLTQHLICNNITVPTDSIQRFRDQIEAFQRAMGGEGCEFTVVVFYILSTLSGTLKSIHCSRQKFLGLKISIYSLALYSGSKVTRLLLETFESKDTSCHVGNHYLYILYISNCIWLFCFSWPSSLT